MTAKHTEGPWSVGRGAEFRNQISIEPTIGCAYGAGDEVKANAQLIAAAPDLLEALDMIHKSFGGGNVITFSDADIEQIGAAIAKATGAA